MSPPKEWGTFKSSFTTALAKYLEVLDESVLLAGVTGRIDSTAADDDYYIQILKGPALPGDTTVIDPSTALKAPDKITHVTGTDSTFDISFLGNFSKATGGCYVVVSTTEFTKTLVTSNVLSCTAYYV